MANEDEASNTRTPHPEANADSNSPWHVVVDTGGPECASKVENPAVSSQAKELRGRPRGQPQEQAPLGLLTHDNLGYPPGLTPCRHGLSRQRERRDRQPRQQEQAQGRQPVMPHPSGLVFFGQPGQQIIRQVEVGRDPLDVIQLFETLDEQHQLSAKFAIGNGDLHIRHILDFN